MKRKETNKNQLMKNFSKLEKNVKIGQNGQKTNKHLGPTWTKRTKMDKS